MLLRFLLPNHEEHEAARRKTMACKKKLFHPRELRVLLFLMLLDPGLRRGDGYFM